MFRAGHPVSYAPTALTLNIITNGLQDTSSVTRICDVEAFGLVTVLPHKSLTHFPFDSNQMTNGGCEWAFT